MGKATRNAEKVPERKCKAENLGLLVMRNDHEWWTDFRRCHGKVCFSVAHSGKLKQKPKSIHCFRRLAARVLYLEVAQSRSPRSLTHPKADFLENCQKTCIFFGRLAAGLFYLEVALSRLPCAPTHPKADFVENLKTCICFDLGRRLAAGLLCLEVTQSRSTCPLTHPKTDFLENFPKTIFGIFLRRLTARLFYLQVAVSRSP